MPSLPALLDPARPGCWRRFTRGAFGCLALGACGLVVAGVVAARQPMGRYAIGAALVSANAFEPGLAVAERLVADHPDVNAAFYLLKAAAQRNVGDIEGHNRTLDDAVAHFPTSFAANDDRCLYGALFGDPAAALRYCDQAVSLVDPSNGSHALAHRGLARALAGEREGAIADLDAAISVWREAGITDDRFARPYGEFLDALRAGRDPFDEAALARERERY